MKNEFESIIKGYVKGKGVTTKVDINDFYKKLSYYYTLTENGTFDVMQIFILKVETTDLILSNLGVASTFNNRIEFAKNFFIYEPEKSQSDYINWLKNLYIESNKDVVKKVHQDAAKTLKEILFNLKIVDRNIGIYYTEEVTLSAKELFLYLKQLNR